MKGSTKLLVTIAGGILFSRSLLLAQPSSTETDSPASHSLAVQANTSPEQSVTWRPLIRQSFFLLGIQHAFRIATEPGTRQATRGSYFKGYARSVANLHGWGDGDPVYVNYVGHPMQGSVTNWLWIQNDRRYASVEFGRSRDYWRSRLRATAFSAAYSAQFELGPFSEASIGQIQARYPQQGFVDYVVTPALGLGWTVAEDLLDKYLIRKLEARTQNAWVRLLVRGGLNPSRSMANVLRGEVPWRRDSRPGVLQNGVTTAYPPRAELNAAEDRPGAAPLELMFQPTLTMYSGRTCPGGGLQMAYRLSNDWQLAGEISGCQVSGLPRNFSADTLMYLVGPRWRQTLRRRWSPYVQLMAGGQKLSSEEIFPELEESLRRQAALNKRRTPLREEYAAFDTRNAFTVAAGAGLELKLSPALALQLAGVDYRKAWMPPVGGLEYSSSLRLSGGVILRLGTW